jgi:DNA-binding transcriptional MerR regulator
MEKLLPAIPAKRYFTIGEVSELCGVKPYVLRYWEQEFSQLKPMKRRGNRRYYQHHEVLLIRRIRDLLHEQGFTISGARNQLGENGGGRGVAAVHELVTEQSTMFNESDMLDRDVSPPYAPEGASTTTQRPELAAAQLRAELLSIRNLLTV